MYDYEIFCSPVRLVVDDGSESKLFKRVSHEKHQDSGYRLCQMQGYPQTD